MGSIRVHALDRRGAANLALLTILVGGCSDPPAEATTESSSSTGVESTGTVPPPVTTTGSTSGSTGVPDGTGSSGSTSGGSTTTGGGSQDCCSPHADPGCDDPELVACVCEQEAFCCAFAWDEGCVDLAEQCGGCGAGTDTGTTTDETTGGPAPNACCSPTDGTGCAEDPAIEACVCGIDPFCCETQWDDQCVQTGIRNCGSQCGGMGGDDCCSPSNLPGCPADPMLEGCVCAADPFCCDEQWDGKCVQTAQEQCGLACAMGGDCCAPHGLPGCDDLAVNDCVCGLDPFCCDTEWDGICVNEAQYACGAECGLPPPNMGDCCTPQPGPGCGDMAVTDCTCAAANGCCLFPWNEECIQLAVSQCGIECAGYEPLDPCCFVQDGPNCGNVEVETCVCAFDAFCCDTQWDGICVDEAQDQCLLDCTGGGGGGSSGGSSDGGGGSST